MQNSINSAPTWLYLFRNDDLGYFRGVMKTNYDSFFVEPVAHQGDVSVLSRLIAEGVDVNTWDRYGRNELTFAASSGQFAAVKMLVDAGAWIDPFEEGSLFMSPLMCAADHGRLEIAEYLLDRGADPTLHGGFSVCTPEYYARQGNHEYLAAMLRRAEDQLRRAARSRSKRWSERGLFWTARPGTV